MTDKELSNLSIPEIIELIKKLSDEIQIRIMETN